MVPWAWAGLMKYLEECGIGAPASPWRPPIQPSFLRRSCRLTGINPPLPEAMARLDEQEEHFGMESMPH